jgi:hypothetical protein
MIIIGFKKNDSSLFISGPGAWYWQGLNEILMRYEAGFYSIQTFTNIHRNGLFD